MKKIFLENGLIAIGGRKNSGKSTFALQLANNIAAKEKVLFMSWQDYEANLRDIILKLNDEIAENLDINTEIDYYSVSSFINIMELIEYQKYTTIFIDDVESFKRGTISNSYHDYENDSIIASLKYLADKYNIRVIFILEVVESDSLVALRDFSWSRLIVNHCEQVMAISQFDHELKKNNITLSYLKGRKLEMQNKIINLQDISDERL